MSAIESERDALLDALLRRRYRVSFGFAAVAVLSFFGFLVAIKQAPQLMASRIYPELACTWAVAASVAMILLIISITAVYVYVAHHQIDPLVENLRRHTHER
jgi:uncharacterized membrane protein (DUF485 family)